MANIKRVNLCYCNPDTMKKLIWFFACFFTLSVTAQEKLVIMGKSPNLYVVHTVTEGESFQMVSSQFGQSVKKLASYNGKTAVSILKIGDKLKIPVTEYSILRVKSDDNHAPLYHVIRKGDNLYRISQANKVLITSLKEWNNLKTDIVKDGQMIIVGYMVNGKSAAAVQKSTDKVQPMVTKEIKMPSADPVPTESTTSPAKDIDASERLRTQPSMSTSLPPIKVSQEKLNMPVGKPVVIKETANPVKKEESPDYIPKEGDEGYFTSAYSGHDKELAKQFHSGDAATFKTISGWTDRKYYVLINDVPPETIVRITGPNNKSICAKVLGPLQETKGGEGLLLRMSNSAASTLGITDAKFTVTVTYFE